MQKNSVNQKAFENLFRDGCKKCFGYIPTTSLSESDCRMLASAIEERTGLVIGAKSLRNYSLDIGEGTRKENPSDATLDTLARYVLDAPYTNEPDRKQNESHFPWWFKYRHSAAANMGHSGSKRVVWYWVIPPLVLLIVAFLAYIFIMNFFTIKKSENFSDKFDNINSETLTQKGWSIRSADPVWWEKRSDTTGHLTLYTLRGDNWQGISDSLPIRNMLYRKVTFYCFTGTIDLTNFVPIEKLSTRELSIAQLLANGKTNDQIAAQLNIESSTIRTHKTRIFQKLDVTTLHDFLAKAKLYKLI